jgi:hypothetical protein
LISDTRAMASEWISARAAEVDQRGDLLRALPIARGSYSSARKVWYQRQRAAHQQQRQQEEGAPEQASAERRALLTPALARGALLQRELIGPRAGRPDIRHRGGTSGPFRTCQGALGHDRSARAVRHEHVAHAPDGLDVARLLPASCSISLRRRETCTSRLRSKGSNSRPRASCASFSRDSGWRGWRTTP